MAFNGSTPGDSKFGHTRSPHGEPLDMKVNEPNLRIGKGKKSKNVEYRKTTFVSITVINECSKDPLRKEFKEYVKKERKKYPNGRRLTKSLHDPSEKMQGITFSVAPKKSNPVFQSTWLPNAPNHHRDEEDTIPDTLTMGTTDFGFENRSKSLYHQKPTTYTQYTDVEPLNIDTQSISRHGEPISHGNGHVNGHGHHHNHNHQNNFVKKEIHRIDHK